MNTIRSIRLIALLLIASGLTVLHAQVPSNFAVNLQATVSATSPCITLSWTQQLQSNITGQYIYRRLKGGTSWGTALATLSTSATSYADVSATTGVEYEYWMDRTLNLYPSPAMGFIAAGVNVPAIESRGKLLLVIDSTMAGPLAPEIAQLENDLTSDGWTVVPITALRSGTAGTVKAQIISAYNADPTNVKMVYVLGHVPVPYSGEIAPDGHGDHFGAWPADGYYCDMTGTWTDTSINYTNTSWPANTNVPGDGKLDQSNYPSLLQLGLGRVDFNGLNRSPCPVDGTIETSLLRRYLRKAHQYRYELGAYSAIPRRSLISDNFNNFDSEYFAITGWAGFYTCVGQPPSAPIDQVPINSNQWFSSTYAGGQTYLMGHANGSGGPECESEVGTSTDYGHLPCGVVFNSAFGSYHGDWNMANNFMRSEIAGNPNGDSLTLCCFWTGRPYWFMHSLGMGETLGYMTRQSMNASLTGGGNYSPLGFYSGEIHLGLMGDPALRIHAVQPPRSLAGTSGSGQVNLSWASSTETGLQGYYVYRAPTSTGTFTRLTPTALSGTTYTDTTGTVGQSYTYEVRTLTLESVPGGTYNNLSYCPPVNLMVTSGSAAPSSPSDLLVVSPTSSANAQLTWSDNSNNETGFIVQRMVNVGGTGMAGSWSTITTQPAGTTSYADPGPFAAGNVYYYQVLAANASGTSAPSNMDWFEASAGFVEIRLLSGTGMMSPLVRTLTVAKTAGTTAPITVARFGGGVGTVTVRWYVSNGQATSPTFFPASSGTLTWADGDMSNKTFTVPVNNTATPQVPMEFYVNLSPQSGGVRSGVFNTISVLITDPTATLPAPWSQALLGTAAMFNAPAVSGIGMTGSTVIGSSMIGGDFGGSVDDGNFIYRPITGDACLTAYINSNQPAASWASLMVLLARDTPFAASSNMAGVAPGGYGTNFTDKINSSFSSSTVLSNSNPSNCTPCWVRLSRVGNLFTAQQSKDNITWNTVGTVTLSSMPTTAYWGLFNYADPSNISSDYSADFRLFQYSNFAFTVPAIPAGVIITNTTTNGFTLQWNTSAYSGGYYIERLQEGGTLTQIASVTATNSLSTQSFSDTGLGANTACQYFIVAYNSQTGTSSVSSPVTGVTTNGSLPSRPAFLTATLGTGSNINLSWVSTSTSGTSFQLQRRVANGTWILLQTFSSATTSYTDTTAQPGILYQYRISATGTAGISAWDTVVSLPPNGDAIVNNPAWSADSIVFNQDTTAPGNSYVPTGFTYYNSTSALPFVSGQTLSTTFRNNVSGWVGMKITVGAYPIIISQLGRWVMSGNSGTHTVKLVNATTGVDIPGGSCSVATSGAPVGFNYTALVAPITLAANTAYYLISQETNGGDWWYEANTALTFNTSLATIQSVYTSDNINWWLYYNSCSYGPVSFQSPSPVPLTNGHSMTTLRNNYTGWMGMKFTVGSNNILASQLGRWVTPGNSGTHAVKLVNAATGLDVPGASTSVTLAGATSGQFQYSTLASPVGLSASTSYYLLSQETSGGDQWYDYNIPAGGTATGYETWLLVNGLPMDASGGGSATATPANDGLSNLMKYALGLTPNVSGNGGHLSYGKVNAAGSNYLSLTYSCPNPTPSDITYSVETSPDLSPGSWTTSGVVLVSNSTNGGLSTVTMRNSTPLAGGNKGFMRLKITQP